VARTAAACAAPATTTSVKDAAPSPVRTSSTPSARWERVNAYVLHTYAYKETSLIVETLTEHHGRVALVAKGAKRPNSALRGLLQPFLPLQLTYVGKGEVKTLTQAEWRPGLELVPARALMSGYYVNELVLKLVPRDDPNVELFEPYALAIHTLAQTEHAASALRRFELALLAGLGYGVNLERCADSGQPISQDRRYRWMPERGVVEHAPTDAFEIAGDVLRALAENQPLAGARAGEAKRFMRTVLAVHLEKRALASRALAHEMQLLMEAT
jgi:DNA repair protein RecO (recombination protein O)